MDALPIRAGRVGESVQGRDPVPVRARSVPAPNRHTIQSPYPFKDAQEHGHTNV
jgi:hypothetical protein